ncbi:extracellular matrix organizing protein FRAS1-like [Antedon mediterranea]|uniref:extracellular matrix organizing protein FRAS1-like n=1 Tax=Antedon mediterranea TaxID=105859 RepID=UPI003AF5DB4C
MFAAEWRMKPWPVQALILGLIVILNTFSLSQGVCFYQGLQHANFSVWTTDPCTVCSCQDSIVLCKNIQCSDPGCDFQRGEKLRIAPNNCCPECASNSGSCQYNGEIIGDNSQWSPTPCATCYCTNGVVECINSTCPNIQCNADEVMQNVHGECCPQCVKVGRQCAYQSQQYRHGQSWSPAKCALCKCTDGTTQCYIADCPPVSCLQGQLMVVPDGQCCPECQNPPCTHDSALYFEGEVWQTSPCNHCSCKAQSISCVELDCYERRCNNNERRIVREGECCAECVPAEDYCEYDQSIKYHGDMWNATACQYCICSRGTVNCYKTDCDRITCTQGQVLKHQAGRCCPECGEPEGICFFDGVTYTNEDVWQFDDCSICRCVNGEILCYLPDCSPCELGTVPVLVHGECCHRCEAIQCDVDCINCNSFGCTSCRDSTKVIQNGRCVDRCGRGFYSSTQNTCLSCHSSCAECSAGTEFHCMACETGLVFKWGQCLSTCGPGFYQLDGECGECFQGCFECTGPTKGDCVACSDSAYLSRREKCVTECSDGYYLSGVLCIQCDASCSTCYHNNPRCRTCPDAYRLQGDICVKTCSVRFYDAGDLRCEPCHPSCLYCHGPDADQCRGCEAPLVLLNNRCVANCSYGSYEDQGACNACHRSCRTCLGPGPDKCTSCKSVSGLLQALPPNDGIMGACVDSCRNNYFPTPSGICYPCHSSCLTCTGGTPSDCTSCRSPLVLQNGICARSCNTRQFEDSGICFNCHASCNTCSGAGTGDCQSCGANSPQGGQCFDGCASTQYLDMFNSCQDCSSSCGTCYGLPGLEDSVCDQCIDDSFFTLGDSCVQDCGDGYYNSQSRSCKECYPTCLTCDRDGIQGCLSCKSGFVLAHDGMCTLECHRGFYNNNGVCTACDASCLFCISESTCLECLDPSAALSYGECVSSCADQYYIDPRTRECRECDWTCNSCVGPRHTDCLLCMDGMILKNGQCVPECGDGYYDVRSRCRACLGGCKSCDVKGRCTSCYPPELLLRSECVDRCGPGYYSDYSTHNCIGCPNNCVECSTPQECTQCTSDSFLKRGRCVEDCGSGFFTNTLTNTCEVNVQPPSLYINGSVITTIGGSTPLDTSFFSAIDPDTAFVDLLFYLVRTPTNGHLIRINKGIERTLVDNDVFTGVEVQNGNIRFVHDASGELIGELMVKVNDRQFDSNIESVPITAISPNPPIVLRNEPLILEEGQQARITSTDHILIHDDDNPENVKLFVIEHPHHGRLLRVAEVVDVQVFTLEELRTGSVYYKHDGSETQFDVAMFQVTDGYNFRNLLFNIHILPTDNQIPMIITNVQAEVKEGHMTPITTSLLRATDSDTDDDDLMFTLNPPMNNPKYGEIVMVVERVEGDLPEGWETLNEEQMYTVLYNFYQQDMREGHVYYHHLGQESTSDTFRFEVSDGANPPNILTDQTFQISVSADNDEPPRPSAGVPQPFRMMVLEGTVTPIDRSNLAFTDPDSPDTLLIYNITVPFAPDQGSIENIDQPEFTIRYFTQADINAQRIVYRPPRRDIGPNTLQFTMTFTVSDTFTGGNTLAPMPFIVSVVPKNSAAPVFPVPNPVLSVRMGEHTPIRKDLISVEDLDTPLSNLVYSLVVAPKHGDIVKNGRVYLQEGDEFSHTELISESFHYNHDGTPSNEDSFEIAVTDGAHVTRISMHVAIVQVDSMSPTLSPDASLVLLLQENSFAGVTRTELSFDDDDSNDMEIFFRLISTPRYGKLQKKNRAGGYEDIQVGMRFSQADINAYNIRYKAEGEIGNQIVNDIFSFNVSDVNNNVISNQFFTATITPVNDLPPSASVHSDILVIEGGRAPISIQEITASDGDTRVPQLVIVLDSPPTFGYIESIKPAQGSEKSQSGIPITSFPVQDLLDNSIFYVQSIHKGMEPTVDGFLFYVTDGENRSPLYRLNISIQLINDEEPEIIVQPLQIEEGDSVTITNATLFASDIDSPDDELRFTVIAIPEHGMLRRKTYIQDMMHTGKILTLGDSFTFDDVLSELIVYVHDSSEFQTDAFSVSLTDGLFTVTCEVTIVIGLLNDETPRLTINHGLRLETGTSAFITSEILRATDVDSNDKKLLFTLTKDPEMGKLQFVTKGLVQDISIYSIKNSFKQSDIDEGYIKYSHDASEPSGLVVFKFNVADEDGNELIDESFRIDVYRDHIPPKVLTNKGITVVEGSQKLITTSVLSATDRDSSPGELTYFISNGPTLGQLEFTSIPGVPIISFTQANLAEQGVLYVHTSPEEIHMDSFIFTLSDGTNEITLSFYITITPVDDSLPLLSNMGMRVQEGIRKTITEFELKAIDLDTEPTDITFTVRQIPQNGAIQFTQDEQSYSAVTVFSMDDIYESRISYIHDGSNTLTDSFSFTITDGTNQLFLVEVAGNLESTDIAQVFDISVAPVDDNTPRLTRNVGLSFLQYIDDKAVGLITDTNLQAMDNDTPDKQLVYTITTQPAHGYLLSSAHGDIRIATFTQEDIANGLIKYVLSSGVTDVSSDSFIFDLADSMPNIVTGNVFRIQWPILQFEHEQYNVSEKVTTIDLKVKRSGNLNQYAVVLCGTKQATATSLLGAGPGKNDYREYASQIQFEERETTKTCSITIVDDLVYEGPESFIVELKMPDYSLLGPRSHAVVVIDDSDDKPSIEFEATEYRINEDVGFFSAPVIRKGDNSATVTAVCLSVPKTARGSSLIGLETGSDYITRGVGLHDMVVFPQGVSKASCDVQIVDDSVYEEEEEFELVLTEPSLMTQIGKQAKTTIVIQGPNDVSTITFSSNKYVFNENSGTVQLEVVRHGSDLSHISIVWCATRMSDPPSARPGEDYVPSSSQITFQPQQTVETCLITLMDDSASPQVEGNETFIVHLASASGSIISVPSETTVVITDTENDIPTMQFMMSKLTVEEKSGIAHVPIIRSGDLSYESSVICFTRQRSAQVMMDFEERRNIDDSRIVFMPGEKVKNCSIDIVEDGTYEADEVFQVKLTAALGNEFCNAKIGKTKVSTITISDKEDAPTVQFKRMAYSVREPINSDEVSFVTITVVRTGDQTGSSRVRCSTRDGSAQSGLDYNAYSKLLHFKPGVSSIDLQVEVLHNEDIEWHETFSIILGPEDPVNALLGLVTTATVTIIDDEAAGSTILPAAPVVVSLMDYGNVAEGIEKNPSAGYPIICVTSCDPHYPEYTLTQSMCKNSNINISNIAYHWEVAMPTDVDGSRPPFERIVDHTPFTSPNTKVLDSVYFSRRFHVRCVAQPYDKNGRAGVPLRSGIVEISGENSVCHTPVTSGDVRGFKAQSFIADLKYVEPEDVDHPNSIHIHIDIPHEDGMLPLLSTIPIHNIRLLLTEPVYRSQHICSNMLNSMAAGLQDYSFLGPLDYKMLKYGPGYDFPYQFDPNIREEKTINLYRHLNLKSCTWSFDAYYHMTELVDLCGGAVTTDFQVRDMDKSYLTVTVPMYVSYIYVMAPTGWASLDHKTEMEFSFFYSSILWRTGLETDSVITGRLQIIRIRIGDKGNLVIDFKTTPKFRGQFVMNHHTLPEYKSRVLSPLAVGMKFELELLWSENTFDAPEQLWSATSSFNLKDFSGDYIIELMPCTVTPTQSYKSEDNSPLICTAHQPEKFVVPIAFQQTNRPVPVVYSLNTEFHLMNNEKVFLMDPNQDLMSLQEMDYQGSFSKGQTIFGRVLWNPDQNLDTAYRLQIEKLFLCTGKDGYVPNYDPTGEVYHNGPQFGCMQESPNLMNRFLVLDRGDPDATVSNFQDIPFLAEFAEYNKDYTLVNQMPGVDGFTMVVDPLYRVMSGHQWYMQVIYTIGPSDDAPRFRRSVMSSINKRGTNGVAGTTSQDGTNMRGFSLNIDQLETPYHSTNIIAAIFIAIAVLFIISMVIVGFLIRRKRRRQLLDQKVETKVTNRDIAGTDKSDNKIEFEMNISKNVRVSSLNLDKPDNRATAATRIKKVNLEAHLDRISQASDEGGTEV